MINLVLSRVLFEFTAVVLALSCAQSALAASGANAEVMVVAEISKAADAKSLRTMLAPGEAAQ
jgi:hypothetical protein